MKKYLLAMCAALVVLAACESKPDERQPQLYSEPEADSQTGIQHVRDYHYTDTIQSGSHTYVYDVERHPSDSLGIVTDESGDRYADNYIDLRISCDGRQYFNHRFLKREFRSSLSRTFNEQSILDGIAFDRVTPQGMRFSISISYPNSDMYMPFAVTISSDGSYSYVQDDVLDVEGDVEDDDADGV